MAPLSAAGFGRTTSGYAALHGCRGRQAGLGLPRVADPRGNEVTPERLARVRRRRPGSRPSASASAPGPPPRRPRARRGRRGRGGSRSGGAFPDRGGPRRVGLREPRTRRLRPALILADSLRVGRAFDLRLFDSRRFGGRFRARHGAGVGASSREQGKTVRPGKVRAGSESRGEGSPRHASGVEAAEGSSMQGDRPMTQRRLRGRDRVPRPPVDSPAGADRGDRRPARGHPRGVLVPVQSFMLIESAGTPPSR